jgi:hypothetical protein
MTTDLFGVAAPRRTGLGGHERNWGGTDEWLTPPGIVNALGPFDLDPCAPINRPWPTAARHYTIEDDGLRQPWDGRVWMNPPYAHTGKWLHRLARHGHGTALVFARTETAIWHTHVWPHATGMFFLRGRIRFHHTSGVPAKNDCGAPSVLVAYGADDAERLRTAPLAGKFVAL